jgi:hypothetical protein
MMRLVLAHTVLLALVSAAWAAPQDSRRAVSRGGATTQSEIPKDDALRARVVEIQQTLDRILAETLPAPVGTTGASKPTTIEPQRPGSTAITIDRSRLLRLRQQLDALLASMNSRNNKSGR